MSEPSPTPESQAPETQTPGSATRRRNRPSRYVRAQERREAQARADQRFYRAIFGVISLCVLVVLAAAAMMSSGAFSADDGGGGTVPMRATFAGLSLIEWAGLLVVAVIGVFMWRRIIRK